MRGLRHELSSLTRPLWSWVRIPLRACMLSVYMCLFCVCVVLCLGRGLATSWSLFQGDLPTVNISGDWKAVKAHKGCRANQKSLLPEINSNSKTVHIIVMCSTVNLVVLFVSLLKWIYIAYVRQKCSLKNLRLFLQGAYRNMWNSIIYLHKHTYICIYIYAHLYVYTSDVEVKCFENSQT
jgi:hypothetical protein